MGRGHGHKCKHSIIMARPLECVKNLEMPECLPESSDQPVPEVYLKSFFYFVSLDTKQLQQTLYTSKWVFLPLLLWKYILLMPRTCSKGSPPLNNRHSFALTTSIFQKMMRIVLIVLLMRNINDLANLLLTPRRTLVTGNISRVSWEANRCEENKEVKAPGHFFFLRERSWENMVMNSSEIFLYSIQR